MMKLRLVSPRVSHIGFLVWLILVSTAAAQYQLKLVSPDFVQGSLPDGSVDKQTTGYTFFNKEPKGHWFVDYTFGGIVWVGDRMAALCAPMALGRF